MSIMGILGEANGEGEVYVDGLETWDYFESLYMFCSVVFPW